MQINILLLLLLLLLLLIQIIFFLTFGTFSNSCVFLENVSSVEKVEPWFFVTFNIILKHIFAENFIKFPHVVQKI